MKFTSIRHKLVFSISLFITIIVVVIATGTFYYFRNATRQLILDQQFTLISRVALGLDEDLTQAQRALIAVANSAPPAVIENRDTAQTWLRSHVATRTIFNASLYILDNKGVMVASVPAKPDVYGTSLAGREYFSKAMSSGKPHISEPFLTVAGKKPAIVMTAPIRGADGTIQGLLCGRIDLLDKNNLFASLKEVRLGSSGYLYLFSSDRTMIMHIDPTRVMKKDVKPGANKLFDRALEGFEGSGETVNSKGRHFLASFKRLQTTGWILAANYPTEEAYQPITRFRNYFLMAMFAILSASIALAWKLGIGISGPITDFIDQLQDLTQSDSDLTQRLDSDRTDELGLLAGSFNSLLYKLQQREQELKTNETRFRKLVEGIPVALALSDEEGNITYLNHWFTETFGYTLEDVPTVDIWMMKAYPDEAYRESMMITWSADFSDALAQNTPIAFREYVVTCKDATVRSVLISGSHLEGKEHLVTFTDISRRNQAEREQHRLAEEQRIILENAGVGIAFVQDRRMKWANGTFCSLFGYSSEEVTGIGTAVFYPTEEDFEQFGATAYPELARGETVVNDLQMRRKDGTLFSARISGKLVDTANTSAGSIWIFSDVTLQKAAEYQLTLAIEAANAAEAKASKLLQTTDQGIYGTDETGCFTFINRAGLQTLGYLSEELIGRDSHSSIHHSHADGSPYPAEDCPIYRANATSTSCHADNEILWCKDGTYFVAEFSSFPVLERGAFRGAVVTFSDVTERRKAEEGLRKLSRAVEQSPVSIVITDVQGTIEFVNPKFTELTGYTAEEAIGQNPRVLKSGQTPPETFEKLWSTITAGKTWEGEFHNKSKDGSLFWEHAAISPLLDEDGVTTHYLAVKEDITEKKSIMEQLVSAKDQAEAATRAKADFLATMSHEIRTPMNGVIGMTGLLLDSKLSDQQREYAEIVRRSGDNLLGLINDILDFSKIESGKLDLELLDFDLRLTLEDTALMFTQRAAEAGVELACRIEPNVPLYLRGDPGRVRQIVTNLIGNALKFTHQGAIVVNTSLQSENDTVVTILFDVHDTGIGIPESRLGAIFEPFTQASGSTTRKYGGTGLGLAICKQLAELMGGEIGVTSEEGKGSTFWFTARFEKQTDGESQNPVHLHSSRHVAQTQETVRLTAGNLSARILLAEDNIINQKVAQGILAQLGCKADVVADGNEAVRALEMIDYDLVLMDCQMPVMDGFVATALIRDSASNVLNHNVPIVAMTANAMKGDREKCLASGMDDYLSKPVKKNELAEMLAKWLSRGVEQVESTAEPADQPAGLPLFDCADMLERLGNDQSFVRIILDASILELPEKLGKMSEMRRDDDVKALEILAHTVKGIASNISAVALHECCQRIETAAKGGDIKSARKLLPELERTVAATMEAIQGSPY